MNRSRFEDLLTDTKSSIDTKLKHIIVFEEIEFQNFSSISEEDSQQVLQWRNHPDIRYWMKRDDPISYEEHVKFLKKLQKDTKNYYFLAKINDIPVGVSNLNGLDLVNKTVEMGLYLRPSNVISDAGFLIRQSTLQLAFELMELNVLQVIVTQTNRPALLGHKFAGFKEDGRLRHNIIRENQPLDSFILSILREEYNALRGSQ